MTMSNGFVASSAPTAQVLDTHWFRVDPEHEMAGMAITRQTVNVLLDARAIQIAVRGREVRWYTLRRNGKTRYWKRDANRIVIPVKYRFRDTTRIHGEWFR